MPQHKPLRLGLPNGLNLRLRVCFSGSVFRTVLGICKMLNIRRPEELSLLRPVEEKKRKKDRDLSEELYDLTEVPLTSVSRPCLYNGMPAHFADSPKTEKVYKMLSVSQPAPPPEAIAKLYRPASVVDKAHIHSRWLDSSRSLMQQGVQENDRLWLRFKYYCFHDLEPKYDVVRLTQMYEQARWAILLEDIECTEEEMLLFGAIQYHINKLSLSEPQTMTSSPAMDDLDSALQCLEVKLVGADSSPQDMLVRSWLALFSFTGWSREHFRRLLRTSSGILTVMLDQLRISRTLVPVVACGSLRRQTGSSKRGLRKSLADSSFQSEVQSIRSFLAMQQTNPNTHTDDSMSINTHSLVSPRYSKKYKAKQLTPRILEAYQNVAQLSLTDALLRFLQIWQALPDFGISLVVVRRYQKSAGLPDPPYLTTTKEITKVSRACNPPYLTTTKADTKSAGLSILLNSPPPRRYQSQQACHSSITSPPPRDTKVRQACHPPYLTTTRRRGDTKQQGLSDPPIPTTTKRYQVRQGLPDPPYLTTTKENTKVRQACQILLTLTTPPRRYQRKSLADSSFQSEVQSIRSFLAMQQTNPNTHTDDSMSINTHSLVSPRYSKKYKVKQLTPRILEAYQNVAQLSLTDALLRFLQIWQALPDFGISFVVVRFKGSRKDEVLGIAPNRLIRIDLGVGDVVKTWRYNNMRQWNVNWDIRQVAIEFDGNVNMAFSCVTADCKIVHEFIGGYIFMSTRSREQSDTLNEELFHKLTGGHEAL
ncbi:fermitin family homolog 3-like [Salvelinus sp. IW2-2015]|uniref:fermitin family homolog 3-like n=1 Tax=Salvelinus sp. IW2-2015 TaxID=2691554 RepID=UPI0038D49694